MLAKLVSPGQNGFARLQYVAGSVYVAVNALRARVGVIFQDFVRYQLSVGEKADRHPKVPGSAKLMRVCNHASACAVMPGESIAKLPASSGLAMPSVG